MHWVDFLQNEKFTHALTIKPNFKHSLNSKLLQSLFVKIYVRIQRRALGPRFNSASKRELQFPAFAIIEGLPYSGHLHAAFKVPENCRNMFESMFEAEAVEHNTLSRLLPGGTWCVKPIDQSQAWYNYSFKQIWNNDQTDRIQILPMR
ncbi:MAG: hypothetical protein JNL35_03630 [Sphingopyxis sp.]|nr:hypothetical protein [Sphingopyxis sp.]